MKDKNRPEWVPEKGGQEFTTRVIKGVDSKHDGMSDELRQKGETVRRKKLKVEDYVKGILARDRVILARGITLVESNSSKHIDLAQKVLKKLLPQTGNSIRVGITGVPGAGKSTFINALGSKLLEDGHKLAVLAVDPSSSITKGSVLGDKTRMETLARAENCFIRPSPSGGALGGVSRKTRETILLCEAAGYDIIFIETVGVGQNEITVRSMVDFFLLLKIAGAGDELQGIKKGVIELADAILINKADGDNKKRAEVAKQDFARALHYLKSPTPDWNPEVKTCSAIEKEGLNSIWKMIETFKEKTTKNNFFQKRRHEQMLNWMHDLIKEYLENIFYKNDMIKKQLPMIENKVRNDILPPTAAAKQLLD
ncbi:MAG: methylmalonyl Co-A mutase-associated GTPase MeaB, partial [Candidatus Cloacimonadota bacterium]|nr:methylmalonyl Co-A mutase-associated GTPase MeaB [Candidatus Cloacimonadota bacterium]